MTNQPGLLNNTVKIPNDVETILKNNYPNFDTIQKGFFYISHTQNGDLSEKTMDVFFKNVRNLGSGEKIYKYFKGLFLKGHIIGKEKRLDYFYHYTTWYEIFEKLSDEIIEETGLGADVVTLRKLKDKQDVWEEFKKQLDIDYGYDLIFLSETQNSNLKTKNKKELKKKLKITYEPEIRLKFLGDKLEEVHNPTLFDAKLYDHFCPQKNGSYGLIKDSNIKECVHKRLRINKKCLEDIEVLL